MASVFIKVPVSERLPKEDGVYIVGYEHGAFSCPYNKQYSFHEEFTDCSIIEWWLEEVELVCDESARQFANEMAGDGYYNISEIDAFVDGFNYLYEDLKGGSK